MTEYKMFEGCTIGNRIPFIETASRKVFDKLGIQTSQAPFSCCPDPTGMKSLDENAWLVMGARNLCLAEDEGKDIISLCNGCANTLRGVKVQLKHDNLKMDKVNAELAKIGKKYKGSIDTKHFLDVLKDDVGMDKIKNAITKQLSGLKVACHCGCHYMRPSEWMESDDPMRPTTLKNLTAATGATVVDYDEELLCCGCTTGKACVSLGSMFENYGLHILKKKLDSVIKAGADVIVVNCPACFFRYDTKQRDVSEKFEEKYKIPVIYLTELYALAMGFSPDEIGLKFHRVRLTEVLQKIGL